MSTTDATDPWRVFADRLILALRALDSGTELTITATSPESGIPALGFIRTAGRRIRCHVADDDLPVRRAEQRRQMRTRLLQAGWDHLPRKRIHIREAGRTQVPDLVEMVVGSLREIWGVADPAMLSTAESRATDAPEPDTAAHGSRTEMGIVPCCPEHLLDLACAALSAETGRRLAPADDAILLPHTDYAPSRLHLSDDGVFLVFSTTLTHRLIDPTTLGTAIVEHSRAWPDMSFVVEDQHVIAVRFVDCAVFHPLIVSEAFARWRNFLNSAVPELLSALNPGPAGAHSCTHSQLPIGLQTLLGLHAERPLTAQRIAHLTNGKAGRIREYLAACDDQAKAWQASAREVRSFDDQSEIELHDNMFRFFRDFGALLRRALLLVGDDAGSDHR